RRRGGRDRGLIVAGKDNADQTAFPVNEGSTATAWFDAEEGDDAEAGARTEGAHRVDDCRQVDADHVLLALAQVVHRADEWSLANGFVEKATGEDFLGGKRQGTGNRQGNPGTFGPDGEDCDIAVPVEGRYAGGLMIAPAGGYFG